MKHVHILRVGIAPWDVMRNMVSASIRGEYKRPPNDPKIWFTSLESLAQVLSTPNKLLLELIAQDKPQSMTELAKISGRQLSNLSRTLKTMENYGLVKLTRTKKGEIRPEVMFDQLKLDMTFTPAPKQAH